MPTLREQIAISHLQEIADATWTEVRRFFRPDGCIIATRIYVDVLAALGIDGVDGWPVHTVVRNVAAVDHVLQHGCDERWVCPNTMDDLAATVAALGRDPNHHDGIKWGGHLVAIVRDRFLVDMSISQVSRPQLTIADAPVVAIAPPELLNGTDTLRLVLGGGVEAIAFKADSDNTWREAPDWQSDSSTVTEIVRATQARMYGQQYQYPAWMTTMVDLVGKI